MATLARGRGGDIARRAFVAGQWDLDPLAVVSLHQILIEEVGIVDPAITVAAARTLAANGLNARAKRAVEAAAPVIRETGQADDLARFAALAAALGHEPLAARALQDYAARFPDQPRAELLAVAIAVLPDTAFAGLEAARIPKPAVEVAEARAWRDGVWPVHAAVATRLSSRSVSGRIDVSRYLATGSRPDATEARGSALWRALAASEEPIARQPADLRERLHAADAVLALRPLLTQQTEPDAVRPSKGNAS
jgi:hypothetical protein